MIALKVILWAIGQQLGAMAWQPALAYLHRAKWPRRIALPWLLLMVVGPVWLCSRLYPRASLLELLVVVSLPQLVGVTLIWATATSAAYLARRMGRRDILPPDGDTKQAPFLRRL